MSHCRSHFSKPPDQAREASSILKGTGVWIWGTVVYSFNKQVDTSFVSGWGNPGKEQHSLHVG